MREAVVRRTKAAVDAGVAQQASRIKEMIEAEVVSRVAAKADAKMAALSGDGRTEGDAKMAKTLADAEAMSMMAAQELAASQEQIKVPGRTRPQTMLQCNHLVFQERKTPPSVSLTHMVLSARRRSRLPSRTRSSSGAARRHHTWPFSSLLPTRGCSPCNSLLSRLPLRLWLPSSSLCRSARGGSQLPLARGTYPPPMSRLEASQLHNYE